MPYELSEPQRRFLRKKYAAARELERCCECPGCEECIGFVRNCTCDQTRLNYFTDRENK